MRIFTVSRALLLALACFAASGCDSKMVRTWYDIPNYQRHYQAAPGAPAVCRGAADRATHLCSPEARIGMWPTDVRCADAEWEYVELCSPRTQNRQE